MKNWKRILCVVMAAALSCPSVSVHASESEETYASKMETDDTENVLEMGTEAWMPEESDNTESTETKEETVQKETSEDAEATVTDDSTAEEVVIEDTETEQQEETENVYNAVNAKQPENPVYNENTDSTKWSYVYFGRYPQDKVTGDDLDDSIINANYNKNGDAVVNGVKYRRLDEGDTKEPEWNYYSYEPIKWRVLQNDGNTLLLLTDEAVYDFWGGGEYVSSRVRSMLNGYDELENSAHQDYSIKGTNFLSMAFYANEQDIMQILPLNDIGTQDLVRVPTLEELKNSKYGFADDSSSYTRKFGKTRYANGYDFEASKLPCDYINKGEYEYWGYNCYGCPLIKISLESDLWSMECPQTSFEEKSLDAASVSVTMKKSNYVYDGSAKEPQIIVKDGNETLTQDIDYTLTYLDNVQAGTTAAVRIDGTGDYVGSKTTYFTIEKADQTINVNTDITKKTTDKKFKLGAQVTIGDGALSYESDNISVAQVDRYGNVTIYDGGVANITVTAQETVNYKPATAKVKLTVQKDMEAESISITMDKSSYVYDGSEIEPQITVKDGDEILTRDIDYIVTYLDNVQAGTTAAVRIDGTGDYAGSKTAYFTIEKADQIIAVDTDITKKIKDKQFKLGAKLTAGDGELSYESDNASVAWVDRSGNVTVYDEGVANITVAAQETANYKPVAVKVKLTVKSNVEKSKPTLVIAKTKFTKAYGDKAFWIEAESEDDVDITFSSNNKKVVTVNGEGKVSIKGCGTASITVATVADSQYDSVKKTIKITVKPKKSTITSLTSKKKAQMVLKWKKDSKASGYEIVYSYNGKSKKVDVKKNRTTSATIKKLKSKKTYSVKIRAYKKIDGKKIYGDYSKVKKIKVK